MSGAQQPSPRVPIDTCEGLFEKLKWDYEQLEEGWNEYRTFNFVVTAYHLYADWINSAGTREQKQRKNKLSERGKTLFSVLRDITNSSKHWELDTKSKKKQVVSEVTTPQIADWYAYLVAGPVMYVSVGSARLSMPEIASITLKCFEWILHGTESSLPPEIEDRLQVIFRPLK
jgi:hypothetical protein